MSTLPAWNAAGPTSIMEDVLRRVSSPGRLLVAGVGLAAAAGGPHNPLMTDDVVKDELRSAIEARKELSDEMAPAVIDAFVARIEDDSRTVRTRASGALQRRRDHQKEVVLGSMAISIPVLAIAAIFTGLAGVIAVCVALAVIAVVSSRS